MKNSIFISSMLLILTACSNHVYQSLSWQKSKIQIDGTEDDWDIPLKEYDKNLKLNYEFTNDGENLYFAARTVDESTIQQIVSGGLKIQLDTLADSNNYPFTLTYPVMQGPPGMDGNSDERPSMNLGEKPEMGASNSQPNNGTPPNQGSFNNQFASNEISLTGFKGINPEQNPVPFSKSHGINALYYKNDEGILFYEMVIPFKTFYKNTISSADTTAAFCCCISLTGGSMGDMSTPPQGQEGSQMSGPPSGGMGGPPPGGMGGGPGGGMGGPMSGNNDMNGSGSTQKDYKIKKNFCLSYL